MDTRDDIIIGSQVWIVDPDSAYIDGSVLSISGKEAEVQTGSEGENKVVANLSKLYPKDTEIPPEGIDDMTKLAYLHEPSVLHNLALRYESNKIYTYCGNILIAVNPFQALPYLYDTDMMEKYKGVPFGDLSPHVFAVAEVAYRAMINQGQNNSILVSGESGSGKTETTKMLMRYLAYLGGYAAAEGHSVEQQVLESNPVLEAFGNAKTVKNNNSSRFGKFVEIQFDKLGRISGAAIRTYLLERSRVCQVSDPERNYHCFYLLCAAPPEEIEKYKLGDPKSFHYLNQSNCYELVDVNDANMYLATRRAMDIVGINMIEQDAIFRIVAAILHLGNVDFTKGEEDSSVIKEESKFHLNMTAELLMCDAQGLEDALCKRMMITPEEIIKRSLDTHGATISRDGLAKTLYSRLFDWLVDKINVSIGQDPNSKNLIGVLDIYGFESFKVNSFEQFCINYTNEKLQQHFNQHVFKFEQKVYKEEEIDWSYVEFVDNQDILDLIEKKPGGIITLLDEACMFPKSTPETFSEKLYQTFKDNKRFIKPKLARSDFTIIHYAGEVQYQSDQFLDKNKDYVVAEHQQLLSASSCSFVTRLFPSLSEESTKTSKFSSIGSRFKLQLQQLMETLNSTEPNYIRCVKPNNALKPSTFENNNVLQQLRSGGVLEAIRIKCAGYPTVRTFSEFLQRFGVLAPEVVRGDYEENVACKWILEKMDLKGYQIGKQKVFLRVGQMAELDARRATILDGSVRIIQCKCKSYVTRKCYLRKRQASICIQTRSRGKLARTKYTTMRRDAASIKIQKNLRRMVAKRDYENVRNAAVTLQTASRVVAAVSEHKTRRQGRAAVTIQASWRCRQAYSYHKKLRKASILTQSRRRGTITRRMYRKLTGPKEHTQVENESPDMPETVQVDFYEKNLLDVKDSEVEENLKGVESEVEENMKGVVSAFNKTSSPRQEVEKFESVNAEIENLKVMLMAEKLRADYNELQCAEAMEVSEKRLRKLEETEKRVYQLQDSLNRLLYSMSEQFSQLKMILHSSNSTVTAGPVVREEQIDTSDNSDASSSDSDFTFPSPSPSPVPPPAANNFSPLKPQIQLMVQDLSATEIGCEQSVTAKEGAFDDYF